MADRIRRLTIIAAVCFEDSQATYGDGYGYGDGY